MVNMEVSKSLEPLSKPSTKTKQSRLTTNFDSQMQSFVSNSFWVRQNSRQSSQYNRLKPARNLNQSLVNFNSKETLGSPPFNQNIRDWHKGNF
mmetsp:Transcript_8426/g.6287  ORF Transcript_8426/g.6287 Transcript_8426/m.6287 type:complete len:93 (-) Transcript_8426:536-814(-)